MKAMGNMMILASAGSGKTYALTNRYVALLAKGARPERIAALTFTRKAAGEFFDEILKKLAEAAGDPGKARKIAGEIGRTDLAQGDFTGMLRNVVDGMHRLSLGTLDSFFARVVRAFPLELGLGGDFEIMQDHAARIERLRVLRRMFAHTGGPPDQAQRDFIEAFKRATFGHEEKRLGTRLDWFLDENAEAYLAAPDPAVWGNAGRIWPGGCPWLGLAQDRTKAAEALRPALPWEAMTDGQRKRWEDFFAALPDWAPGAGLPGPLKYIMGNTFKEWPSLDSIVVERRRLPLSPAGSRALKDLAGAVAGAELSRRLQVTRGIFDVVGGYDAVYDRTVRRAGKLTFADLQRLLRPDIPGGSRPLSRDAGDDARLFIDWRLDAQIDHWLLDEFQDTSFGQWSVLRNLIDEAVQDPSGTRSFFYVGDVKQAIFAWRGGDSRLFREIFNHYNAAAPGVIHEARLDESYRSGKSVIALVNNVMGNSAVLEGLFPEAAARWSAEWRDHRSNPSLHDGYAALRTVPDEAARFRETLEILRRVRPLERGLEVAVLVKKNEFATAIADYLRREGGLPAVAESDLNVGTDNPLTCALLALFRAAAHPGDETAREHLRMTPLQSIIHEAGLGSPDALTLRILGEIHALGFERTIEAWMRMIEPRLEPGDAFSRERGRQLSAAARIFDESGSRDVAEFNQFIERYTARDTDTASVVRVMTVHKAKGLGFDLVILPDLEGNSLDGRRRGLAIHKGADRSVEWVLQLPSGDLALPDAVLDDHVRTAEADACYENLCLLYVAMTRAKTAMYLLTDDPGKSSSKNFPRLLRETLGGRPAEGNPDWFADFPETSLRAPPAPGLSAADTAPLGRAPRRTARRPSDEGRAAFHAGLLFAAGGREAAEFGTAVHRLLAQVEWTGPGAVAAFAATWAAGGAAGVEALGCIRAPGLAAVWERPGNSGETAEVWRERAFEVVLDGEWVSGVLDRVVVSSDAAGRALRASVFDFKTDRLAGDEGIAAAAARYSGQLNLYRSAAALLAGLDPASVSCGLVFTRLGRSIPVPRP